MTFRSFPRHLKPIKRRGLIECAMSGFLRRPEDTVVVDGMPIAKDKADFYGAFGYTHPGDVKQPELGGDPTAVPLGGLRESKTAQDLQISDQERALAIKEDRPPRAGY